MLTDRQKEVFEKQQATAAAMFPDIRSSPVTQSAIRTSDMPQLNLTSDASNADEPLDEGSRTPLAALPSLGPMDYYLGSSPTPRARTRSQHMLSSGRTSVAPNATRPIHLEVQSTDIPSSPPDLGEEAYDNADSTVFDGDVRVHDEDAAPNSFEHSQVSKADEPHQGSVDTTDHEETMDNQEDVCKDSSEDMNLAAAPNEGQDSLMDDEPWSELPSSTADLELSAQIAAEIDAHLRRPEVGGDEENQSLLLGQTATQQNVGDVFSDCLSDKLSSGTADSTEVFVDASPVLQRDAKKTVQSPLVQEPECSVTSDARYPDDSSEIAETQAQQQTPILPGQLEAFTQDDTEQSISDASRVGDSFSVPENELAALENCASIPEAVRKSPRKLVSSSNTMARATLKRKEPPVELISNAKRAKRASQTTSEAASTPSATATEAKSNALPDCIMVTVSPPPASHSPSPQPDIVDEPTLPSAPVAKSEMPASQSMLAPPTPTVSSTKRKPGRPRKVVSESQSAQKPAASLKRRTRLSAPELDRLDSDADALVVEDTPAPKRMRTRASQDMSRGPSSAPSESGSVLSLASLAAQVRRVSHVEIGGRAVDTLGVDRVGVPGEASDGEAVDNEEERADATVAQPRLDATTPLETADEGVQEVRTPSRPASSPDDAAAAGGATPTSSLGRVMLTPRSILGRLKKILSDCSQMVLGSQEERQFDDVLFELRTEVHAAGRRGRGAE